MLQLKVEAIKWEAPDTASFYLREVSGKRIAYQAGQFITLVFDHHNEELRRSYSISSSPDEDLLAITIKRVPNGEFSRFVLSHSKIGDVWQAEEPVGRFVLADIEQQKDIFFFAAGSGITPILSQIKYILKRDGESKLTLVYSNRNTATILFKVDLDQLQQHHPERLTIIHLLSDEARRLNVLTAEQLMRQHARFDLHQAQFYLCGPFEYMRMVKMTLSYLGIPAEHIRKENFVVDTVPAIGTRLNFAPHQVRIHHGGQTYDIVAGANQSILQAALQNNIRLPYSCRVGICSTCSAKCISGKVEVIYNEVLSDKDLADGWILTCTGYALGDDVEIRF